jgi:hypothetical protein
MKTILFYLLVTGSVWATDVSDQFINALIKVESRGNDSAVGDNGKAYGCLQIWNVVILDVNRVYKTNYTHKDAFDRVKSKEICRKYIEHWSKYYKRKTGSSITNEGRARLWNSGPKWWTKKHKTNKYWEKVKNELNT